MGIPVQQGLSSFVASTGATTAIWPTHIADDVGLLIVMNDGADATMATPSGWSPVTGTPFVDPVATSADYAKLQVFWRRATSSSEANVSIPDSGQQNCAYIVTFRGCKPTGDPFVAQEVAYLGFTQDPYFPSITVGIPDALVLFIGAASDNGAGTMWDTPTNSNLTSITQVFETSFTTGFDGQFTLLTAELVAGTGSTGLTTTVTNNFFVTHTSLSLVLEGPLTIHPAYESSYTPNAFVPTSVLGVSGDAGTSPAITPAKAVPLGLISESNTPPAAAWSKTMYPVYESSLAQAVTPVWLLAASDGVSLGDTAPLAVVGKLIREQLSLASAEAVSGVYTRSLAETLLASDVAIAGWPVSLADTVNVSELLVGQLALTVAEELQLTKTQVASLRFGLSITDTLSLQDALARFLSGVASDTLNLTSTEAPNWLISGVTSDALAVSDSESYTMVFRVTSADELAMSDEDLLAWIFSVSIDESVEFTIGAVSPTGDFTAWAVNTSTAAVSEYTNFGFNSFADMYPHYLAASSAGLYELTGDSDAGASIISKVRSGYAQLGGGARLSSLDTAYLGMRGDGTYIFRVATADGQTYDYTASVSNMRNSRVQLGRGLRARYIAFELESTGADFDLESVEILPLALSRRV